jgi:hypothetical protein
MGIIDFWDVKPYSLVYITNHYFHRLVRRKFFYTEDGCSSKPLEHTNIYQNFDYLTVFTLALTLLLLSLWCECFVMFWNDWITAFEILEPPDDYPLSWDNRMVGFPWLTSDDNALRNACLIYLKYVYVFKLFIACVKIIWQMHITEAVSLVTWIISQILYNILDLPEKFLKLPVKRSSVSTRLHKVQNTIH